MKLVSIAEMQAIEREANAAGWTYDQMMQCAGIGLAEVVHQEFGGLRGRGVVGLVGSGNNGGDTLVALTWLAGQGWPAAAYIVRPRPMDDPLMLDLQKNGGNIITAEKDPEMNTLSELVAHHAVLLDGILGTGISLPLKAEVARVLRHVRSHLAAGDPAPVVVAVDCPSGVNCDTGEAAEDCCIPARITVTMAAIKQGLLRFPAFDYVGELRVVGIGLPNGGEGLASWRSISKSVIDADVASQTLPDRPKNAHKGTFGTAFIIAGSLAYTGAAGLAAEAAYRIGAGLVTLGSPLGVHRAIAGQLPEVTWRILTDQDGFIAFEAVEAAIDQSRTASAILVGPGLGLQRTTGQFMEYLLRRIKTTKRNIPLVIDADGLKHLASLKSWPVALPPGAVLTPHPGEMSVLTGLAKDEIQSKRQEIALKYSQEWGTVVVLKGAFTVIASPDGRLSVIPVATPALARAGTGDVLAGLIVGLRAQGIAEYEAATCSAWIHAQAGLAAARQLGNEASVLASDVLRLCTSVLSELISKKNATKRTDIKNEPDPFLSQ